MNFLAISKGGVSEISIDKAERAEATPLDFLHGENLSHVVVRNVNEIALVDHLKIRYFRNKTLFRSYDMDLSDLVANNLFGMFLLPERNCILVDFEKNNTTQMIQVDLDTGAKISRQIFDDPKPGRCATIGLFIWDNAASNYISIYKHGDIKGSPDSGDPSEYDLARFNPGDMKVSEIVQVKGDVVRKDLIVKDLLDLDIPHQRLLAHCVPRYEGYGPGTMQRAGFYWINLGTGESTWVTDRQDRNDFPIAPAVIAHRFIINCIPGEEIFLPGRIDCYDLEKRVWSSIEAKNPNWKNGIMDNLYFWRAFSQNGLNPDGN